MELNAELFRQLSIIAEDETLMRKAVEAIRRLAKEKEEAEYISKKEILAGIEAGLKDVKAGRTTPAREFLKELRDEV